MRPRKLDAITRRDVEGRFHLITERHGPVPANQCMSFLRSVYRRPCVYHEGLRSPLHRDVFLFGLYTGMRRSEIFTLHCELVDLGACPFRVEETETGERLAGAADHAPVRGNPRTVPDG